MLDTLLGTDRALRSISSEGSAAGAPQHPSTRRWTEQRWLLDNIIQANGIDWDQPRSIYLSAPCGSEANADFAAARLRIRKYADAAPAFEALAKRRQARAEAATAADETVTARDNHFIAAVHWGAAQWPIDAADATNLRYNAAKRANYRAYAEIADHQVEEVWIPLGSKKLPAWLHLPYGYTGGRVPVVIAVPGMDSFKECSVSLYGDRWLNRGIAVLAIDGPGQYECPLLGIYVTPEAWASTGTACVDWLLTRPEIDGDRIGLSGTSFGTFFSTLAGANEPRIKAIALNAPCLEPGCHTIFEEASPTFKMRFMFMANYTDEAAFDRFAKTLSWRGHAEKITAPLLCLTGESDELSPLHFVEEMMSKVQGPRQLVIYQDSRHAIGAVPAATLGPFAPTLVADWMQARLAGKPMTTSERWYVDATGKIDRTYLS